jgi:drug/metabolite transporter (DMT)-like permease
VLGVLFVIIACTLWALDTLIRYPLLYGGFSPDLLVFTEHALLCLVFSPVITSLLKKFWQAKVKEIFYFAMIGGLGSALATLTFTKAFVLINPSLVILLQKFQPLVAIVFARIVLGEQFKRQYFVWAILCLVGAFLISFQDISGIKTSDFSLNKSMLLGYGLTLFSVVSWGLATVFGKALENNYSVKEIMAGRFFFGLIFLIPIVVSRPFALPINFDYWAKISIMVGLSGIAGMYFYYRGLRLLSARLCTLAELFFPFCAVALNWIFLGKSLDAFQIAGGLLLLTGSTIIKIKHY